MKISQLNTKKKLKFVNKMANSIVKVTDVTDNTINNSLLLLVGEDGTVTPDRRTVDNYLNSKSGPTNLQIMHIDKCDQKGIDVIVDNVMYVPDNMDANKNKHETQKDIKLIEANLHNIQLDHDYSRLIMLKSNVHEDEDELAKALSILDGNDEELEKQSSSNNIQKTVDMLKVLPSSSQQLFVNKKNAHKESLEEEPSAKAKGKIKVIRPVRKSCGANKKDRKLKKLIKQDNTDEDTEEEEDDVEEEEEADDEDFDMEMEDDDDDDDNDSDFEIQGEETIRKLARISGKYKTDAKQQNKQLNKSASDGTSSSKLGKRKFNRKRMFEEAEESVDKPVFKIDKEKLSTKSEQVSPSEFKIDKPAETGGTAEENKLVEKKPKKKKEPPKPIPGDFALFSTPDIIRKVSKEATTPETPPNKSTKPNNGDYSPKPGRIMQECRSKSSSECSTSSPSKLRLSLEERDREKTELISSRLSTENKNKENSSIKQWKSIEKSTERRSAEESDDNLKFKEDSESLILNSQNNKSSSIISDEDIVGTIPLSEVSLQLSNSAQDPNGIITLDTSGLDLDQAILDNINNDLISEDILYQVAKQLVANTELQNAIDKGINEGVLLDTSGIQELNISNISQESSNPNSSFSENQIASTAASSVKEGTQIVRSDGRILVLPPIERPTTRSRNKKKDEIPTKSSSSFKTSTHHKPLDEEHVSGNELDSSDEDDEEESEDDPNKLWCICNQPHNNRFMICCDTCEEWYHGKCVNITKSMGQQMESDGKEWICLFCKDPTLKRPLAAAKRMRKASRNSRQSTDSASTIHSSSATKKKAGNNPQLMPCVVCQKIARKNSIYCSEECILAHAQGIERVVVFERSTGRMLTGNKAPSASELNQWLKNHPGYEVVKSGGKIVTTKVKPGHVTQSKLKIVKNPNNHGVSLAIQQKGVNIGVLSHSPKHPSSPQLTPKTAKIINKTIQKDSLKESKIKLIKPQPMPNASIKPKEHQTSTPIIKKIQIKTISTRINPASITPSSSATTKILKSSTPIKEMKLKTPTPKMRLKDECGGQPKAKEDIRDNVQKTVFEQLIVRLKDSEFTLIEDEIKRISIEIEAELYKCFGDTGQKYKNKYRSLIFNIKDPKNQTLWRRICERSISSYELVRLSPDDMASQELAKWREQEAKHQLDMIKKSEIELLNCNRQYVLKTHKGEEVLEDTRVGTKEDHTEIIKSLTEGSPLDPGSEIKHLIIKENEQNRDNKRAYLKHNNRKDKIRDGHSSSKERSRKRSRSKTRHDKNKKIGSEKRSRSKSSEREKSRERDKNRERHKKSSSLHKISRHNKIAATNTNSPSSVTDNLDKRSKEILEHLNKIAPPPIAVEDRLWKHVPQEDIIIPSLAPADSDSDNEVPTSTVTIPTPPRVLDTEDGSISEPSDDSKPSTSRSSINKEVEVVEPSLILQGDQSGSLSPPPSNNKNISTQIWSGTINMVDVAQISITAHEVSGDCAGLSKELCPNLDIVGRISPDTVWDYIGKMRSSNSKLISLLRLNATNVEEQMPYLALYSYLSSRNRLGVVKSTNKAIKDFYILPLAAQKPIPQALLPINGPVKQWLETNMKKINDRMQNGFEESRPALLLGIIVRDKRKRSYLDMMPQTYHQHKKQKIEVHVIQTNHPASRSYTPPPVTPELATSSNKLDPCSVTKVVPLPVPPPDVVASTSSVNMSDITKIMSLVSQGETSSSVKSKLFEVTPSTTADGDEPYSPGDSDPDTTHHSLGTEAYVPIPGLGDGIDLSAKKINFQRQMEELNKQIEMQKFEISSITKNIAATAESEIVGSALASIALPSNLQQILDSIKTIGNSSTSNTNNIENLGEKVPSLTGGPKSDLTIPLLIPKTFSRPNTSSSSANNDTIPLNLPSKLKFSPPSMSRSPLRDDKLSSTTSGSVLSSLSEADLIKKAAEMLKEQEAGTSKKNHHNQPTKKSKMEISLPPVPGVDD